MKTSHIPKIVAPGGSYQKAMVASQYGAEEVYVGVPFTSLRMRQNKISGFDDLKKTVDDLHTNGSSALLTMNIFPRNMDIGVFESVVEKIADVNPDGIIFSDPGTFQIIKKYLPNTPLHLSTQSSTLNYAAVKFRYDMGVKRVVLARELHISEIAEIKKQVPEMELEVFVHGAMCMSYSGRCLLGDYLSGRPGNKGECSHACRFKYKVRLEEERRPGKFFQLDGDEDGDFILSSKDLCTIQRLGELLPYVDALKIEGRSKSEFYVGTIVKAYKAVRDSILSGKEPTAEMLNLVNLVPHREYWDGFLFNNLKDFPEGEIENVDATDHIKTTTTGTAGPLFNRNYFGMIEPATLEKDGKLYHQITPKEVLVRGQSLQYLSPKTMGTLTIKDILDPKGKELDKATCNTPSVYILTDTKLSGREVVYQEVQK